MKILLLTLNYLHQPELGPSFTLKNKTLHFVNTYLQCKLSPPKFSNKKFSYVVTKIWGCNENKYRSILNDDNEEFTRKMRNYYSLNKKKPEEILFIKSSKIMSENHINLLASTVYKSNVRILDLSDCNLNDYYFSKFFLIELNSLVELRLNDNDLTIQSVKNMTKMNFSKSFEYLEINYNNMGADALKIILTSDVFKYLVSITMYIKRKWIENGRISQKFVDNHLKLCTLYCNYQIFKNDGGRFGSDKIIERKQFP